MIVVDLDYNSRLFKFFFNALGFGLYGIDIYKMNHHFDKWKSVAVHAANMS